MVKVSKEKKFQYNLKYKFGITPDEYYSILKSQHNKCAVCGKLQDKEKRHFACDHNHKTGCIRGLLCNYCNSRLLRYLRDDKNRAKGLVKYLQRAFQDDTQWV